MPTIVLLVTVGAGLAMVLVGALRLRADRELLRTGRRVPGEVVDHRVIRGGMRMYTPVVRFRTHDAREVTASPGAFRQTSQVRGESAVTVVYDEERPGRILVDGGGYRATGTALTMQFLAFLLVGAAVATGGIVVFLRLA